MFTLIGSIAERLIHVFETPRVFLIAATSAVVRVWIALVFWRSGLTKIADWETTLFLFEEEYDVPLISYEIASYLATAAELILPILLVIGLGTRFASVGLLIMTAVIEFTYESSTTHIYWALAFVWLIVNGAGRFSWDDRIRVNTMQDIEPADGATGRLATIIALILTACCAYEVATTIGGFDATPISDALNNLSTT